MGRAHIPGVLAAALIPLLAGMSPSRAAEARAKPLPGYARKAPAEKSPLVPPAQPALSEEERRELRDGVAAQPPAKDPPEKPAPGDYRQDPFWLEHRKLVLDLRLETLETRLRDRTATRDELAAYREYDAERKRIKKLLKAARKVETAPPDPKDKD